jgi:hypothetical protein
MDYLLFRELVDLEYWVIICILYGVGFAIATMGKEVKSLFENTHIYPCVLFND